MIRIRSASMKDVDTLTEIEAASFPRAEKATRESFENRAILYSILTELQSFLQIKRQFYLTLPEQERKQMFERLMQA